MPQPLRSPWLPAFALCLCLGRAWGAEPPAVTADQVVDALQDTFGIHPGQRRNHTKGTCAAGEFVGSQAAQAYTRSALFSGKAVPVIARFSLAGGNPAVPDTAKNARGMALEFRLPGGKLQHITMLNTPMFNSANPKTFLDMTVAQKPDSATHKPDPARFKAFLASHPDGRGQAEFLDTHNPPVSYANSAFYGIHTFKFINAKDATTLVRWEFEPEDGEKRLTDAQLKTAGPNFLQQALIDRMQRGPARWDMMLTIGQPGDPQNDPTQLWPAQRKTIKVGTLSITAAAPQQGAPCEAINFDPMVMADGIAATDDPVLQFRSAAYAVSFARRVAGK